MDHTPTSAPRTRRAVTALHTQLDDLEVEPVVVDAAHILRALLTAALAIGGADEHVWHWLHYSANLSKPRAILSGRGVHGADHLVAYDRARPEHRRAVREIITAALTRTGATS